ncbi:MAG TPA: phenylalanine--tRNA ligase subunit beta [Acidobacteriaceae bacterium]|jgi:phenylalanyl-tRNA synthetase beta chain|nr:phenylalanine--tRNA ligase subunit beta [Acidobacteriaceae bacterium]
MRILSSWLRSYLPELAVVDRDLADDLTLRGIAVEGVFDLGAHGSLFEMDITTNRVDAMNHYGIAREAATIYGLKLAQLDVALPAGRSFPGNSTPDRPFPVRIEEPKLCGRFTARVLRDVRIVPATGIVAERFRLLEQKPISNAVDATNYVTLAIGQPTHVFDLDKLEGGIVVRRARKGEKLRTLDGVERTLDPDDLVVADEKKAVGLAGVMGGWDTMITAETKNILVEAAWFDPVAVRRSSKRHMLHTDASHRFERGADFNAPPVASALVSRLVLEAGGSPEGELVDVVIPEAEARTARRASIGFSLSEVQRILGPTQEAEGVTAKAAESILTGLGCDLVKTAEAAWSVTLPSWRLDLEREIDLIEEIARVYGYNRFRDTLPAFSGTVVELPWAEKEAVVRGTLLALGWNEAVSSSFCSAEDAAKFVREPGSAVAIGNPLSEEAGMLRSSLLPGMLDMLVLNISRDVESAALFEMGTVFSGSPERVDERPSAAVGASGPAFGSEDVTFYDLKGTAETLLGKFASRSLYFDRFPAASGLIPPWLHPGRSARAVLDGATVGWFGQLHPSEAERRKLKQAVWIGEFWLDRLYRQALRQPVIEELSRFQPVRRDFSVLLPDNAVWSTVVDAVQALPIPELRSAAPKEVLRDAKGKLVPAGSYSLLLGIVFQSHERTLREDEVQQWSQQVVAALESVGGKLRG